MPTKLKEKFVPLTNDILFKDILGNEKNIRFLEDLLECYFGYEKGYLKNKLHFHKEQILDKIKYQDKNIRADILVRFEDKIVDIEIYTLFNEIAFKKSKYYIMRIYATQLDIGQNYDNIAKVIQINFIKKVAKIDIQIRSKISNSITIGNDFKMDIVRLDKAREIPYTNDRYIKWLKFMGSQSLKEREEVAKGDEILMELSKVIDAFYEESKHNKLLTREYWDRKIYGYEGEKKGIKNNQLETAKRMLDDNLDIKTISKYTGLSKKEILKLKK